VGKAFAYGGAATLFYLFAKKWLTTLFTDSDDAT
jgi:hypothetical protein